MKPKIYKTKQVYIYDSPISGPLAFLKKPHQSAGCYTIFHKKQFIVIKFKKTIHVSFMFDPGIQLKHFLQEKLKALAIHTYENGKSCVRFYQTLQGGASVHHSLAKVL